MSKIMTISSKAVSNLTTPQLLKGGLYLTWAASLLLLIVTISGVQRQRHAIKTVGNDATPSIVTAQRLKNALAGMDANVANELLVPSGQNQEAAKGYRERYEAVAERLVTAAENITYGDKEVKPIEVMQLGLGDYIAKIQQARDFHARGETNSMLFAYRAAGEIMDKQLLPASDELNKVNLQALEDTYTEQKAAASQSLILIVVSGVALINILVGLQIFLSLRMRRTLNPGLLGATAIAFIFLYYTGGAFLSASQNLRVAKEDAFTSIYALLEARAAVYIANATESRYLLDSAFANNHEQAFIKNISQIAELPKGYTFESIAAAYNQQDKNVPGFKGSLDVLLNNITFEGEQKALVDNILALGKYVAIDGQIRQLERSGKHQEAIALCVGKNPGQSNWAFDLYKSTHQKVFDINDAAFNNAIKQGFQDVQGFEITTSVALSAIALLTLFGLRPRLQEYSA